MKNYKSRDLSDTIGTVGSMLLFLLFAGCMLMIIAAAAGTYSRISTSFNKTFGTSASLRYISNKIKASESAEIINDGSGIVLRSGGIAQIIYFKDGVLYEKPVTDGGEIAAEGGERIFELNSLKVSEDDGLYRIDAMCGGESGYTYVSALPGHLDLSDISALSDISDISDIKGGAR